MALICKWAWAGVGGYTHIQYGWEDYDFWCRCVEFGFWGRQAPECTGGIPGSQSVNAADLYGSPGQQVETDPGFGQPSRLAVTTGQGVARYDPTRIATITRIRKE